jgi:hypothetical protein
MGKKLPRLSFWMDSKFREQFEVSVHRTCSPKVYPKFVRYLLENVASDFVLIRIWPTPVQEGSEVKTRFSSAF